MDTQTLDTPAAEAKALTPGQSVIVRSGASGVHAGTYVGHTDTGEVTLTDSRRLWRWHAAQGLSLNGVAVFGIVPDKSKVDPAVENVTIFGACEIIIASDAAAASIKDAPIAARY